MYLPSQFRTDDPALLREIMRRYDFATVVTARGDAPYATHVPLLLDGDSTLLGHLARANPHLAQLDGGEALAIFHGPHAYVSPTWYAGDRHVPTWNYVAVHAYGKPRLLDERELRSLLARLVAVHEAGSAKPWKMGSLPADFLDELCREIVGFAIAVERVEGKLKLSQNREPDDRRRVFDQLDAGEHEGARATAEWMKRLYRFD